MPLELIRYSEASKLTGLSHQTLRNYAKQGLITSYRVGKLHKVSREEVQRLIRTTEEFHDSE